MLCSVVTNSISKDKKKSYKNGEKNKSDYESILHSPSLQAEIILFTEAQVVIFLTWFGH